MSIYKDAKIGQELCRRIKLHLTHRGITKMKLSNLVGLSPTYVGGMVRRVRKWNYQSLDKLCDGLKLDQEERDILNSLGARADGWRVPLPTRSKQLVMEENYE